ncbi:MAG: von Willebrand factor type A domain-containing protein [Planctomycetota bacterium]
MNLKPDDPRLTAYALGELSASEAALIERELRLNEDARRAVDEIRTAAANLGEILKSEEMPGLDPARRERIVELAEVIPTIPNNILNHSSTRNLWIWRSVSLVAASLVIGVTITIVSDQSKQNRLTPSKSIVASDPDDRRAAAPQAPADKSTSWGEQAEPQEKLKAQTNSLDSQKSASSTKPEDLTNLAGLDAEASMRDGFMATPNSNPSPKPGAAAKDGALPAGAKVLNTITGDDIGKRETNKNELRGKRPEAGGGATGAAPLGGRFGEARKDEKKSSDSDDKESKAKDRGEILNETLELLDSVKKSERELNGLGYLGNSLPPAATRRPVERAEEQAAGERYKSIIENQFINTREEPVSTLSADVDTASYSNARRFLLANTLPPRDSVRIEEFINYFPYRANAEITTEKHAEFEAAGAARTTAVPFSVKYESATCPWNPENRLLRIAIQGREIPAGQRKPSNLVFLVDVSGSMDEQNKLPLLKQSLKLLVDQLTEDDRVSIVTYAGRSSVALSAANGAQKLTILNAIDQLEAGGGTNGGAGIHKAYETAIAHFKPKGINRVILATDGDFNVGIVDQGQLIKLIEEKAKSGVFLSVLGFGTGNIKEDTMEQLASRGNGHFAYIDNINEGRKVLVEQMSGTLSTIAKDVKLQIQFDPAEVASYRLLGYENRKLAAQDFSNDKKDAGDVGAGHHVVIFYEWAPVRPALGGLALEQQASRRFLGGENPNRGKICNIGIRYKHPENKSSQLLEFPAHDSGMNFMNTTSDFQFSAAVASFALLLRDSQYKGSATADLILELAKSNLQFDPSGYRAEFVKLVQIAKELLRK